jgi:hypothetical protein
MLSDVMLKKLSFACERRLATDYLEQFAIPTQVSVVADITAEHAVITLTQYIYGETLEDARAEYPSDWWQAFKQRWFPAWLLQRYPVKVRVVEIEVVALYPSISAPGYPSHIKVLRLEHTA